MVLPFNILDVVLHFDKYLPVILQQYGMWTYVILFSSFSWRRVSWSCPTFRATPFFLSRAPLQCGMLNIWILLGTLILAVILGDTLNYWIGYTFEMKVLEWKYSLVKKEHLEETQKYFEKYGGFTIVIARFMPFIRTFAPFLAGVGRMRYSWFLGYNALGGVMWASLFLLVGVLCRQPPDRAGKLFARSAGTRSSQSRLWRSSRSSWVFLRR